MFFKVTSAKILSKYLLISVLSVVLLVSALFLFSNSVKGENLPQNAATNKQREEFLKELGVTPKKDAIWEVKAVEIPYKFSTVYEEYNLLQQRAGYDLKPFSGKKVELYTVKLEGNRDDLYAHLLVLDGSLIGGDIAAIAVEDGYMLPLKKIT